MAVQVSFIFRWNAYYSSCSQPKPILTRDFFFKKETLAEVNFYLSEESSSEDCIITANIAKQECSPFLKIIPLGTEFKLEFSNAPTVCLRPYVRFEMALCKLFLQDFSMIEQVSLIIIPVHLSSSGLDISEKSLVNASLANLNMMLNDDVDIKISHLVMQRFKVTEKAILSVIEGGRLVNCTFLEDLISALEKSFCFSLHNYEKYWPEQYPDLPGQYRLFPQTTRKVLLKDFIFLLDHSNKASLVKIIEACEGQVVSSLEAGHIPVTTDKILGLIETDYSFASSDKSHLSDNFSHCKSKVAFVIHEGEITQAIFMGILPEKMTSSYPRLIVDFYKSFGKFYSCQPQVIAEKPLLPPKGKMLINGPLIDRLPTGTQLEGVLKSVKIFCKAAPSLAEGSRRIIPCYSSSHLLRKKNNNLHHEDVFSLEPSAILSTGNLIVSAERKGTASRIEKASSSASVVDKFATSGVANEIENGENNSGFQSSFFKKRRRL